MRKWGFGLEKMKDLKQPVISSIPVFMASQVIVSISGVGTTEIVEIYEKYLIYLYQICRSGTAISLGCLASFPNKISHSGFR